MDYKNRKTIIVFFIIILTFMDGFPIFPSVYKPAFLWIILIFFVYAFINFKCKISKEYLILIIYYVYSTIIGLIKGAYVYKNLSGVADALITVILSIISYISYRFIFQKFRFKEIREGFFLGGNFLIALGTIEMLSYYRIIPSAIKNYLNIIFTGSVHPRFKLINNEASWAIMTLLFFFCVFMTYKRYIQSSLIAAIIILSFSAQGIVQLLLMVLWFFKGKNPIKNLIKLIFLIIILILSFSAMKYILLTLGLDKTYYGSRFFLKRTITSIEDLMEVDGSVFVRIGYILVGIKMGIKNLFFGVGLGNYRLEFPNEIIKFNNYYKYEEILSNIRTMTANSKNIFVRSFSEGGIIGFSILLFYFKIIYQKAHRRKNKLFMNLIILLIVLFLQFDSYVYLLFPMATALIDCKFKRRYIKRRRGSKKIKNVRTNQRPIKI